jgi:cytochrome c-type biogenesis protein
MPIDAAFGVVVAQKVTYLAAFLAGLATFLTPCVLPLVPVWLALAARGGQADQTLNAGAPVQTPARDPAKIHYRAFWPTLFFVLGFSLVFVALGAAASAVGEFLFDKRDFLRLAGGIVMIAFGLSLLGINLPFSSWLTEKRLALPKRARGYLGSFAVGLAFAAGWTPCVGPVLGSILAMAAIKSSLSDGAALLGLFSLGLALPFLTAALLWGRIQPKLKGSGRYAVWLRRLMGLLAIAVGILLLFDKIGAITPSAYPY